MYIGKTRGTKKTISRRGKETETTRKGEEIIKSKFLEYIYI